MKWAEHNDLRLTFKKQEGSRKLGRPQLGWENCVKRVLSRAGTNTPSDEYDTYRDTGRRIRYVSRIHFFSEAKLGNG